MEGSSPPSSTTLNKTNILMKWIKEHPYKTSYIIGGAMVAGSLIVTISWSPWIFFILGIAIIFFTSVIVFNLD
jgi:hypothetical protein